MKDKQSERVIDLTGDDFGFEIVDIDQVNADTTEDLQQRLQAMFDLFIPLLNNLAKNPEKEVIKWPNRLEKIEQIKQKARDILNGREF